MSKLLTLDNTPKKSHEILHILMKYGDVKWTAFNIYKGYDVYLNVGMIRGESLISLHRALVDLYEDLLREIRKETTRQERMTLGLPKAVWCTFNDQ